MTLHPLQAMRQSQLATGTLLDIAHARIRSFHLMVAWRTPLATKLITGASNIQNEFSMFWLGSLLKY
jgi:hypothetical protein